MSADEIKALAQQAFVDGMANHKARFKNMELRCKQYAAALLAYAAMVERCEERRYENMDLIDYILKGATDGK